MCLKRVWDSEGTLGWMEGLFIKYLGHDRMMFCNYLHWNDIILASLDIIVLKIIIKHVYECI